MILHVRQDFDDRKTEEGNNLFRMCSYLWPCLHQLVKLSTQFYIFYVMLLIS